MRSVHADLVSSVSSRSEQKSIARGHRRVSRKYCSSSSQFEPNLSQNLLEFENIPQCQAHTLRFSKFCRIKKPLEKHQYVDKMFGFLGISARYVTRN